MVVSHPWLDADLLRTYLRAFQLGEPFAVRHIPSGLINTIYALETSVGRFVLRIAEDCSLGDAFVEERLLLHLNQAGLRTPTMLHAGSRGPVLSLAVRRQLSVFAELPGRELPVFAVKATHAEQIGRYLGKLHRLARGFAGRRKAPLSDARLVQMAKRCAASALPDKQIADLTLLQAQAAPAPKGKGSLPRGTLHGCLSVPLARFQGGELCGVGEFGHSHFGPLLYDLCASLAEWAFPLDAWDLGSARALLAGYERERSLEEREWQQCYSQLIRYLAASALVCMHHYEVHKGGSYRDYQHYMRRLRAMLDLGEAAFVAQLRGAAQPAVKAQPALG